MSFQNSSFPENAIGRIIGSKYPETKVTLYRIELIELFSRDNNSKVLIHCKMGVSRSASTVSTIIILSQF